ncbi:putative lysine decarboxylase [Poriferisphaera corsica]|uniref:AMP nucleosidase n=1 Tax=Poriferisphaera corsica TaxID=2528020 RepID=A0A517YWA4_9BACT|nr:LOG family protein [Poriferisphaera corsica]QDU34496.1 putative lysine decarboxylase [Poriferisphaera corsica]
MATESKKQNLDTELFQLLGQAVEQTGTSPDSSKGKRIREMMHTACKLSRDHADLGELKLLSQSLKEMRYALKVFRQYPGHRISIFGSARTPEDHPDYIACVNFSKALAESGWMVITGAGDGIMRAGHGGAGTEKSFGVSISLPFEATANDIIQGDPKLINFRYFFTRKLMFMWHSHAIALFPGGFGTQDEGFEALTLIQTGKAPILPIVCIDAPGGDYWHHWDNYMTHSLLDYGWISPEDKNLYFITDDHLKAVEHIQHFYRNYHSQRFVFDTMVIRIKRRITDKQLQELNTEFACLVKSGNIEQGPALRQERDHTELPRIYFESHKNQYGTLRRLINKLNDFDVINNPAV